MATTFTAHIKFLKKKQLKIKMAIYPSLFAPISLSIYVSRSLSLSIIDFRAFARPESEIAYSFTEPKI